MCERCPTPVHSRKCKYASSRMVRKPSHLAGAQRLLVAQPHLGAAADGAHLRGGEGRGWGVGQALSVLPLPSPCRLSARFLLGKHNGSFPQPPLSSRFGRGRRSRAPPPGSPCCTTPGASAPHPAPGAGWHAHRHEGLSHYCTPKQPQVRLAGPGMPPPPIASTLTPTWMAW